MKFSSLAALTVVKMTTSSAASDENFVKLTTFSFECGKECVSVSDFRHQGECNGYKKMQHSRYLYYICRKEVTGILEHGRLRPIRYSRVIYINVK